MKNNKRNSLINDQVWYIAYYNELRKLYFNKIFNRKRVFIERHGQFLNKAHE